MSRRRRQLFDPPPTLYLLQDEVTDFPVFCSVLTMLGLLKFDLIRNVVDAVHGAMVKLLCARFHKNHTHYLKTKNLDLLNDEWDWITWFSELAAGKSIDFRYLSGIIVYYSLYRWYYGYTLHPVLYCYLWYGRAFNIAHYIYHCHIKLQPAAVNPTNATTQDPRDAGNGHDQLRAFRLRATRHRASKMTKPFRSVFIQFPQSVMSWLGWVWMRAHFNFHRDLVRRELEDVLETIEMTQQSLRSMNVDLPGGSSPVPTSIYQIIAEFTFSERMRIINRERKIGYVLEHEIGFPMKAVDVINECLFHREAMASTKATRSDQHEQAVSRMMSSDYSCPHSTFQIQHLQGEGHCITGRLGPLMYRGKEAVHRKMPLRIMWGEDGCGSIRFVNPAIYKYEMRCGVLYEREPVYDDCAVKAPPPRSQPLL